MSLLIANSQSRKHIFKNNNQTFPLFFIHKFKSFSAYLPLSHVIKKWSSPLIFKKEGLLWRVLVELWYSELSLLLQHHNMVPSLSSGTIRASGDGLSGRRPPNIRSRRAAVRGAEAADCFVLALFLAVLPFCHFHLGSIIFSKLYIQL